MSTFTLPVKYHPLCAGPFAVVFLSCPSTLFIFQIVTKLKEMNWIRMSRSVQGRVLFISNLLTQVDSLMYVACYCAFQSPPLTEYHCSLGNLVYAIESKSGIAKHPLS